VHEVLDGPFHAAEAQIRDARFDLDHCRITAPFTGRIGTHLVSVGNLIAGSRAAANPTALLATLVSLDPVYFNFDMSEADYETFSRARLKQNERLANQVALALGSETDYSRHGTLVFVDNRLDRSSGTLHARATVSNVANCQSLQRPLSTSVGIFHIGNASAFVREEKVLVLDETCGGHPCPQSELAFDDSNCARTQHNAAGSRARSGACTAFSVRSY
jgi:hypothetical protein